MYDFQEQFYQVMTKLRANSGSRAASAPTKDDARVTEIINGLLVSKPAKKKEAVIIDLQEYARSGKAASIPSINKVKVIADFLNAKRY